MYICVHICVHDTYCIYNITMYTSHRPKKWETQKVNLKSHLRSQTYTIIVVRHMCICDMCTTHTHAHTCAHPQTSIRKQAYANTYTHTHIRTPAQVHTHAHPHKLTHTHKHPHKHADAVWNRLILIDSISQHTSTRARAHTHILPL